MLQSDWPFLHCHFVQHLVMISGDQTAGECRCDILSNAWFYLYAIVVRRETSSSGIFMKIIDTMLIHESTLSKYTMNHKSTLNLLSKCLYKCAHQKISYKHSLSGIHVKFQLLLSICHCRDSWRYMWQDDQPGNQKIGNDWCGYVNTWAVLLDLVLFVCWTPISTDICVSQSGAYKPTEKER